MSWVNTFRLWDSWTWQFLKDILQTGIDELSSAMLSTSKPLLILKLQTQGPQDTLTVQPSGSEIVGQLEAIFQGWLLSFCSLSCAAADPRFELLRKLCSEAKGGVLFADVH